jgi:uncharacterized protein YdaU (DUF1376 family)
MDWYRWFPGLYSEATLNLNLEQDAIYRRLIDWYMVNRVPLPKHSTAFARICQISIDKWEEHSPVVLGLFALRGDKYHNKRCDIELERQDRKSRKLSEAAKKGAEARSKTSELSSPSEPRLGEGEAIAAIEERRGEERRGEQK